jgi:hypothetical protein
MFYATLLRNVYQLNEMVCFTARSAICSDRLRSLCHDVYDIMYRIVLWYVDLAILVWFGILNYGEHNML